MTHRMTDGLGVRHCEADPLWETTPGGHIGLSRAAKASHCRGEVNRYADFDDVPYWVREQREDTSSGMAFFRGVVWGLLFGLAFYAGAWLVVSHYVR